MTRAVFRDAALEKQLRTAGYAIIPCLDADEVARVQSGFGAIAAVLRGYPFSASIMCGDPDYRAAVHQLLSTSFQRAMDTLLLDYRFVFGNFVVKQVGPDSAVPFHQDITFVDERQFDSMNFWVPLDSVLPGGGRLRVVPGSQQLNTGPRGTERIFPYGELVPEIERLYAIELEVPPGYAVAMNQRLFHASEPNMLHAERVVASALMVPRESELVYLDQTQTPRGEIAVYSVDDDFYRRHVWGMPVTGHPRVATLEAYADPLTLSMLEESLTVYSVAA